MEVILALPPNPRSVLEALRKGDLSCCLESVQKESAHSIAQRQNETLGFVLDAWHQKKVAFPEPDNALTRETIFHDLLNGDLLLEAVSSKSKAVVECLLSTGFSANQNVNDRHRPLTAAAISGDETVIKLLLKSHADTSYREEHSATALHFASSNPDSEAALRCTKALLELGESDVMARTKGTKCAPLHAAVLANNVHVVNILLNWEDGRTMVTSKCMWGGTVLHMAAALPRCSPTIIQSLLEAQSDPHAHNSRGESALDVAKRLGNEYSVRAMSGEEAWELEMEISETVQPIEIQSATTSSSSSVDFKMRDVGIKAVEETSEISLVITPSVNPSVDLSPKSRSFRAPTSPKIEEPADKSYSRSNSYVSVRTEEDVVSQPPTPTSSVGEPKNSFSKDSTSSISSVKSASSSRGVPNGPSSSGPQPKAKSSVTIPGSRRVMLQRQPSVVRLVDCSIDALLGRLREEGTLCEYECSLDSLSAYFLRRIATKIVHPQIVAARQFITRKHDSSILLQAAARAKLAALRTQVQLKRNSMKVLSSRFRSSFARARYGRCLTLALKLTSFIKRSAPHVRYFITKTVFAIIVDRVRLKKFPHPFRRQRTAAKFLISKLENGIKRASLQIIVSALTRNCLTRDHRIFIRFIKSPTMFLQALIRRQLLLPSPGYEPPPEAPLPLVIELPSADLGVSPKHGVPTPSSTSASGLQNKSLSFVMRRGNSKGQISRAGSTATLSALSPIASSVHHPPTIFSPSTLSVAESWVSTDATPVSKTTLMHTCCRNAWPDPCPKHKNSKISAHSHQKRAGRNISPPHADFDDQIYSVPEKRRPKSSSSIRLSPLMHRNLEMLNYATPPSTPIHSKGAAVPRGNAISAVRAHQGPKRPSTAMGLLRPPHPTPFSSPDPAADRSPPRRHTHHPNLLGLQTLRVIDLYSNAMDSSFNMLVTDAKSLAIYNSSATLRPKQKK